MPKTKTISQIDIPNLSDKELKTLSASEYKDGTSIISNDTKYMVKEIKGMLETQEFPAVLKYLKSKQNAETAFWDQKSMDMGKKAIQMEISNSQAEIIPTKLGGKCKNPKCQIEGMLSYVVMQTRAGDEALTTFVSCAACGRGYKK